MDVAHVIMEDEQLIQFLFDKKSLPMKQLVDRVQVSRKTIERQRKYIIAIVLILAGEFQMLQEYIR